MVCSHREQCGPNKYKRDHRNSHGFQGGYKLHVHTIARDLKNDYAGQILA